MSVDPTTIEAILRAESPGLPFPPASDRTLWAAIRSAAGAGRVQAIIDGAGDFIADGVPDSAAERRRALADLTLAECLAYEGRFITPLAEVIAAICDESTWHARDNNLPVDLFTATTGHALAEAVMLLRDALDPALVARVRQECDTRLFVPYRAFDDPDMTIATGVTAGVTGAALALLDDPAQLAAVIDRALQTLRTAMTAFTQADGDAVRIGEWREGFGAYALFAHLIEQRTNRRLDLFAGDAIREIAAFPLHVWLGGRAYVDFYGAGTMSFPVGLLALLAERLDLPDLRRLAVVDLVNHNRTYDDRLPWALRNLVWGIDPDEAPFVPPAHDWQVRNQWMVSRLDPANPDGLIVAAQGGRPLPGAVEVRLKGERLVAGFESMPVANGYAQQFTPGATVRVLDRFHTSARDMLALDLKTAYPPEANADALRRFVAVHRQPPPGWLEITDGASFRSQPGMLASVLLTAGAVEDAGAGAVILRGDRAALRVEYAAEQVAYTVERGGVGDMRRVCFAFKEPVKSGMLRLKLTPLVD